MELSVTSSILSEKDDEENTKQTNSESSNHSSKKSNQQDSTDKFDSSSKSDMSKSYKEKISNHFKHIKRKTIRNHDLKSFKIKVGMDKLRKQEYDLSNKIKTIRNNFGDNTNPFEDFFCGVQNQIEEVENTITESISSNTKDSKKKCILYHLPQRENFQMKLSEKDSFIMFDRKLMNICITANDKHKDLEEGLYVNQYQNIQQLHFNLLKQRLLAINDKKWFNENENLKISENPLTRNSLKPEKFEEAKVYYLPHILRDKCNEVMIIKENILEIYLIQLKFTHHPLFSLEHVFAGKLCNLFDQYRYYIRSNKTEKIKIKLEALRYLRGSIRRKTENDDNTLKRLANIGEDIKKTRKMYFEEGKKERENLRDILNTWKQIKTIRKTQNFSNTNVKLLIKREEVDYETDVLQYKKLFYENLEEIIEESKCDLEDINEENKCDSGTKAKTSCGKQVLNEQNSDTDNSFKNLQVDEKTIRKDLKNIFQESFRAPGEPIIKLSLTNNNEITDVIELSKETARRNSIKSTKMYLNILCDNIVICKSKPITLNDNFTLNIKETISIQLQKTPKYLNIEVIEQSKGLLKKKICQISVIVPAQNISSVGNKSATAGFETNEIVHYKHAGVGSGINLKQTAENLSLTILDDMNCNLTTAGYLEYFINWEKTSLTEKDSLETQINLLKDVTDKNLGINVNKLSEWLIQTAPDPQNPENVVFFEYMEPYDAKLFKNNKNFRVGPHVKRLEFCNISEIEQNIRFIILQMRNQNDMEFDRVTIPNRIKEIPFDTLENIERRKHTENKYIFEDEVDDEIDAQRRRGEKYLKQVRTQLFQICKSCENNLTYESVMNEKYLAHFEILVKTLLKNVLSWFYWQPSKPLLPPVTITRTKKEDKVVKQCNVIIKIISAKNVPNRTKYAFDELSLSEGENSKMNYIEVKPFIEILNENISMRTNISSGGNPVWNETLILPLQNQNIDYLNPDSLNGTIQVNLYDEYDYKLKYPNKKYYRWLGSIEIPLSAVCYSTSISGLFKVKLAQVLLGYETEIERHISKSPKINNLQSYCHHTYIQMELSITPNVPKLIANMEDLPCGDIPYIQQHIIQWNQSYNSNFPNRKFSALAIDTNAKTTCITRYLKPLEPPQINLEEFDVTAEQCLRYISLIPFTECNQFYHNVWLTTNMSSSSDTSSDEELLNIVRMIPRPKIYRKHTNPFEIYDNIDFKARFRFSKESVTHIMNIFNLNVILERETNRNHPVSPVNQLLLTLRFFATGSFQITLGDHINIHKSTVSRIVTRFIRPPRTAESIHAVAGNFYQIANFPRVLAAIDCTHIRILSPGGDNAELYRNRKGWFSINTQVVCDANMKITNIVARWPGSVHDSRIFNTSLLRAQLEAGEFNNTWLIGDSGYPCKSYLLTPLLNPITRAERRYNAAHIQTRNIVERTFGIWKKRFASLHIGLRVKVEKVVDIIVATAVLHNIAIDLREDANIFEDYPVEAMEDVIHDDGANIPARAALINTHFA